MSQAPTFVRVHPSFDAIMPIRYFWALHLASLGSLYIHYEPHSKLGHTMI